METGTGGTAVHAGVDGVDHHVVSVYSVVAARQVGVADHREGTAFLEHTRGEPAHGRAVEHECAVGVVSKDTVGRAVTSTVQGGTLVVGVTVLDHEGVVRERHGVVHRLDGHAVTVNHGDALGVGRDSSGAQGNRVVTDGGAAVTAGARGGLEDGDGGATVTVRVTDFEGVVASVGVGRQRVVLRVAREAVGTPRVGGAVGLGDLDADLVAPAVGAEVEDGFLAGGEGPRTRVKAAVVVLTDLTQSRRWGRWCFHLEEVDTTVSVRQVVANHVTAATVDQDTGLGGVGHTGDVVVLNGEIGHVTEVDTVSSVVDRVVRNRHTLGVTALDGDTRTTEGWVHHVVLNDEVVHVVRWVAVDVSHFTTVLEGVAADDQVVGTVLTRRVRVGVGRQVHQDTNHTVVERVVLDRGAVAANHGNTRVLVVQAGALTVATEVGERAVRDVEPVQLVAVVVTVAHGTVDGGQPRDAGVVHHEVHGVVQVAEREPLRGAVVGRGQHGHRGVAEVGVDVGVVAWVHAVGCVVVVRSRHDPGAAVPVLVAVVDVEERCVHHDGLVFEVGAVEGIVVTVLGHAVAERSRATRGQTRTGLLVDVAGRSVAVAQPCRERVLQVHVRALSGGVRQGQVQEVVAEVTVVVRWAHVGVGTDHGHGHRRVARGGHGGHTGRIDGLGRERDVLSHTAGVGLCLSLNHAIGVLQDNLGVGHGLSDARDVGLDRDVNLALAVEQTRAGHADQRGVDRPFDEVHRGRTRNGHVLRVGQGHIGQGEVTRTACFNTHSVVGDRHVRQFHVLVGVSTVLERSTGRAVHVTGQVTGQVVEVVHTGQGLVVQVKVGHVDRAGGRAADQHTVVTVGDVEAVERRGGLTGHMEPSVGGVSHGDVLVAACGKGPADLDTVVGTGDGTVGERRRTGLTEVVAEVRRVIANTGHEVVAVLVVVVTTVQHVNPKGNLRDVAGRDVNDRHGHPSALAAAHVVRVGVVQTDTVVVRVSTGSIAGRVTDVTGLALAAGWLSVATLGRCVHAVEVERWGVVTPVAVRVCRGTGWRHAFDGLPTEAELVGSIVGAVAGGLAEPEAVEVVVVAVTEVVGTVVDRVVVAVPRRCTTVTTAVGTDRAHAFSGVAFGVGVVTDLVVARHVPGVAVGVGDLHVVAVGDEVVLARSIVVRRVSVTATVDRVGTELQVVTVTDVVRQVKLVGGPASSLARKGAAAVDGGQRHTAVARQTNGVAVGDEAVNVRSGVVRLDTNSGVAHRDTGSGCPGVLEPQCRTRRTVVDDGRVGEVGRTAVHLDRGHVVGGSRCTVDGSTVLHHQFSACANVQSGVHGGVLCDVTQGGTVQGQRTVLDVQVEAVGGGHSTDRGRVARGTFVVGGDETGGPSEGTGAGSQSDHRAARRRAQDLQRTALQFNTAAVQHQVSRDGEGGVVKGEGVRTGVPVARQVGPSRVVHQGVTVQRGVVEDDRCRFEQQVKVVTPRERVVVPRAGQRNVAVIVGVGLVLTGRTEGTNDVVFVGRRVAVSHHNPNAGVAVGVGDVRADLEHLVHAAVEQGGRDHVVSLPDSHTAGQAVGSDGSQATVVDHGRRSNVHGTVAG